MSAGGLSSLSKHCWMGAGQSGANPDQCCQPLMPGLCSRFVRRLFPSQLCAPAPPAAEQAITALGPWPPALRGGLDAAPTHIPAKLDPVSELQKLLPPGPASFGLRSGRSSLEALPLPPPSPTSSLSSLLRLLRGEKGMEDS